MLKSMTGFGRAVVSTPTKKISVEIKSLNSKQLDLSVRAPQYLREAEIEMRHTLSEALCRGKVDVSVIVEQIQAEAPSQINVPVLRNYKAQLEAMADELGIAQPEDWYSTLMRLPDALQSAQSQADEVEITALSDATAEAVKGLDDFRCQEGLKLEAFFRLRIDSIRECLERTEDFESERVPKIRKRLEDQLEKLAGIDYDKGRLEQELIFYIEKLDVNEEKQRLRSHLNYFIETMGSDNKQGHGKKLGFIAQEMGREINTLGSKSNDADMQRLVVMMKDELEQIKEQVLNVL